MQRKRVDTGELNARLLAQAESLVSSWLPAARKMGKYFRFGGVDGSAGNSAWVNLDTGAWRDEATTSDKGGDLISLYAAVRCGGDNAQALRELAAEFGAVDVAAHSPQASPGGPGPGAPSSAPGSPARAATPRAKSEWTPVVPVPPDAPDFRLQWGHFARGKPDQHWEYRDKAGALNYVVCRFTASDGTKDVQPLSYCTKADGAKAWRYKAPDEPRLLYGVHYLGQAGDDEGAVLIVEGEKCADALRAALGRPVLAWQGGGNAVGKADWSPLAGRTVRCWPDADAKRDKATGELLPLELQPGMKAMRAAAEILEGIGCTVSIVDPGAPGERPDGWDCADAIAEGWSTAQLLEFMGHVLPAATAPRPATAGRATRPKPRTPHRAAEPARQATAGSHGGQGGGNDDDSGPPGDGPDDDRWRDRIIFTKGQPAACVANAIEILSHHPAWLGVVGYDEFADRTVKLQDPPYDPTGARSVLSNEWTDIDDTMAAAWIAHEEGIVVSSPMVAEAVTVVARLNGFHPVREYLAGLAPWDGTDRLDHWLSDHLHVKPSEYSRLVGRWFLMAMVARVLQPGVKFDHCLVFEGGQGLGKSTAARVLGGPFYSDVELDLASKDALSAVQGKWVLEISEMGALARAEAHRQKSFLSRQFDEYRPVYGRREVRRPRQVCFIGTTNEWHWQKDPTGGRRFWPVLVPDRVNIEGLQDVRDHLFAEAYARVLARERFWPTGDEQREIFDPEQLSREAPNTFVEIIGEWMSTKAAGRLFSMHEIAEEALKLEPKSITRDVETRIGQALAKLGCEKVESRSAAVRFRYRLPVNPASAPGVVALHGVNAEAA